MNPNPQFTITLINLNIFLYYYIWWLLFLEVHIFWTIKAPKTVETYMCKYATFAWNKRLMQGKKLITGLPAKNTLNNILKRC